MFRKTMNASAAVLFVYTRSDNLYACVNDLRFNQITKHHSCDGLPPTIDENFTIYSKFRDSYTHKFMYTQAAIHRFADNFSAVMCVVKNSSSSDKGGI